MIIHCNLIHIAALETVLRIDTRNLGGASSSALGLTVVVGISSVILWAVLALVPLAQVKERERERERERESSFLHLRACMLSAALILDFRLLD